MIRELSVASFGAFHGRTFPIGAVTLFSGGNESGKTTLFDALFDALCHPKGAGADARTLRVRYGDDRKAAIAFDGDRVSIDPEEFLRLYAIRSGDLDIQLSKGKDWQDRVRAALFSGGIDPAALRDAFLLEASLKGNARHNKAIREKRGEREKIEREKEELERKREGILTAENLGQKSENDLTVLAERLKGNEKRAEQLLQEIGQQDKIRRRRECLEIMRFLDEGEENSRELGALAPLKADGKKEADLIELSELEGSIQETRDAFSRNQGGERNSVALIESQGEKVGKLEKDEQDLAPTAGLVRSFLDRVRTLGRETPTTKRTVWSMPFVTVAAVCLVLAIAAIVMSSIGFLPAWTIAVGILLVGTSLALFFTVARRTRSITDAAALENAILVLKDEWRNRARVRSELSSHSIDGLADELVRLEADHAAAVQRLAEERAELTRLESGLGEFQKKAVEIRQKLADQEEKLANWLAIRHTTSSEDYRHKRKELDRLAASEQKWQGELARKLEIWKCEDAPTLRLECKFKMETLDKEITASVLSEVERRKLENERDIVKGEIEKVRKDREDLAAVVTEQRGIVKGSLGDIPERMVQIERSLPKMENDINELETTREAAEIAASLFGQLVGDTRAGFLSLAGDIAALFGELLPDTRSIEIPELDEGQIKVGDAGGVLRSLENLSRGTRDSFLLAARLALALRYFTGQGVLVLDEPFQSLDSEREKGALSLLASFHQKKGWQIILFSKEASMVVAVKEIFPYAVIHTL